MKNLFFLFLIFFLSKTLHAQVDTSLLYLKFPAISQFSLIKVPDSTKFTKDDLKRKKPVIMIGFSPDCEHCQHETKELIAHIKLFKNVQIVMFSALDYKYLLKFYEEYHLNEYPNITVGRDGSWMLGSFYSIRNFPAIFLYNKKGKFIKAFDGSYPVEKIADAL